MRAVRLIKTCLSEELQIIDVPIPLVIPDWVLVRIKAFGVNVFEVNPQDGLNINLPRIPGLECVGEIVDPSNSHYKVGQRVCAFMGGMGLSFDGSYAEFCLLPEKNVFAVNTDLTWNEMAAVPLTWFTAWSSLFKSLQLKSDDTFLVHGGTSAFGIAAIQIAKNIGCKVLATTKQKERLNFLASCGATPLLDNHLLSQQLTDFGFDSVDKVLELVMPANINDCITQMTKNSTICYSGNFGNYGTIYGFDLVEKIRTNCTFFPFILIVQTKKLLMKSSTL
jgi:NADPH:quinone reductase